MNFKHKSRLIYPRFFGLAIFALLLGFNPNTVSSKNETTNKINKKHSANNVSDAEFSNPTPIIVADATTVIGTGNPYPSNIDISGLTGTVSKLRVTLRGFSHTFPGDIAIMLVAPNGRNIILQSDVGGGADAANITYTFDDSAAIQIPEDGPLTSGTYRPTSVGDDDPFPAPAPATPSAAQPAPAGSATLANRFNGIDPNGTWNLYIIDPFPGDSGNYNGGWTLDVATGNGGNTGGRRNTNADFDGDGKTDFAVVGNPNAGSSTEADGANGRSIQSLLENRSGINNFSDKNSLIPENHGTSLIWYINNSSNNTFKVVGHGQNLQTDTFVPEDFDGDGKDDIAVWRPLSIGQPSGNAFFYILNSSDNTVREVDFGQGFDTPIVTGDYDGDGKSDPAVFRCPTQNAGQCFYFYKGSLNNPNGRITYVPWGNGIRTNSGSSIFVNLGDFDGDGKYDFCVQRENPAQRGQGQFVLLRSSDFGVEYINSGLSSDFVAPGDYDGDGKSDFMNVRVDDNTNNITWYLLTRSGATSQTRWGKALTGFTEFLSQGDFDGDGKTDIGIWRRDDADPNNTYFYILRSSNLSLQTYELGAPNFLPVPGWNIN